MTMKKGEAVKSYVTLTILTLILAAGCQKIEPSIPVFTTKTLSSPSATSTYTQTIPAPVETTQQPLHATSQTPESFAPGDTIIRPGDRMVMIYIPGGTFLMGSTDEDVEDAIALCKRFPIYS